MWTVARYLPVAPFSLKPASATASGGMTLLVPTPYALKMALVSAAIRVLGLAEGERLFPLLRDCTIAIAPPQNMVVMKSFGKIQRLLKDKSNEQKAQDAMERKHWPMQPTIAYREYVFYQGDLQLALAAPPASTLPEIVPQLLAALNYFGKRGGFVQLAAAPTQVETLPAARFVPLTSADFTVVHQTGTLQMLDDCGPTLTFQRANIYTPDRIALGKERILRHIVLPYQLLRSSRSYSWYQAIEQEGEK